MDAFRKLGWLKVSIQVFVLDVLFELRVGVVLLGLKDVVNSNIKV